MLFGAGGSMVSGEKKSTAAKAAMGVFLALVLVLLPLLTGADMVFAYYLERVFASFDIGAFLWHLIGVAAFTMFFYSYLWNMGYGAPKKAAAGIGLKIDTVISCIALVAVCLLYALFCTVQFTYLFAGAGLPDGMTYSDYAREGFAQIIALCAINLLIFGAFLHFSSAGKAVRCLLAGLLALTGVMLASGFLRLKLYIDAYGLTWLRLLSAWFILYLAVVLALCAVRMVKARLPLVAVSAVVLLGWYTALGYVNPDALVIRHNLRESAYTEAWLQEHLYYVAHSLSDDAVLELLDAGLNSETVCLVVAEQSGHESGLSLSSYRLGQRSKALLEAESPAS